MTATSRSQSKGVRMDRIINKLKTEPVRVRLYSIIAAIAAYLLVRGIVSASDVEFILTMAGLVLAVERTRAKVMPMAYEPKHKD